MKSNPVLQGFDVSPKKMGSRFALRRARALLVWEEGVALPPLWGGFVFATKTLDARRVIFVS